MLTSLLTPWRLKWYSIIILFGIFSAVAIVLFTGTGPSIISGRLGGDFTAFYATGRMVAKDGFTNLYNLNRQIESQRDLYPDQTGVLPFAYPPYVALACIPLSFFTYRAAFSLHLLINAGALFAALFFLKQIIHGLDKFYLPVCVLSLTFYPFLKAVLNGQITAIIFMSYALVWFLENSGKHYLAGIVMVFLLLKPQFFIPILGLFLLSGRKKAVFSAIASSVLAVSISLFLTGPQVYTDWYHFTRWFIPADSLINGHNAISWIGFFNNILSINNNAASGAGYFFSFSTVLIISYIWLAGKKKSDFDAQMSLAITSFILIPPHVMFYDAGLLVLTYLRLIREIHHKVELILFIWITGMTQAFADMIDFSPIFLLVTFTFFLSLKHLTSHALKSYANLSDNNL